MSTMGHAGLPVDPERAEYLRARGLPVYQPTDPVDIDQSPVRAYLAKYASDPKERIGNEGGPEAEPDSQ